MAGLIDLDHAIGSAQDRAIQTLPRRPANVSINPAAVDKMGRGSCSIMAMNS